MEEGEFPPQGSLWGGSVQPQLCGEAGLGSDLISQLLTGFIAFEGAGGSASKQELPPSQSRRFSSTKHLLNWNFILLTP